MNRSGSSEARSSRSTPPERLSRKGAIPSVPPIVRSTTFHAPSSREQGESFRGRRDDVYTRFGNPTTSAAAEAIALMEGAEAALVFSSGMAAITSSILTVVDRGAHVVAQRGIFAQTRTFLELLGASFGLAVDFVDAVRPSEIAAAVRPGTRLVYVETPSNPLLEIVDLSEAARAAHGAGALLFVDSTFASPALQNPLALGADLVLHSATKFLGGHSDLLAGAAAGAGDLIRRIKETQILLGGVLDPGAAFLLLRGLRTLSLRVARQADSALAIARGLGKLPGVRRVRYPFLEDSPFLDLARRQMSGGGGVVSFEVEGGLDGARAFLESLETIPIATSLGGVETVAEIPWELDFGEEEIGEAAAESGITPGLVRISVGVEPVEDLLADLEHAAQALSTLAGEPEKAPAGA